MASSTVPPAPRRRPRWALRIAGIIGVLLVVLGVLGARMMGGPRGLYGFLRWAALRMHQGDVEVGAAAPDVTLLSLDGKTTTRLSERIGRRPLVLNFGSFT